LKRGDTPIKKRSEKTAKAYRDLRVPFVKEILAERPTCERCGVRASQDVHEVLTRGRSGGVHGTAWLDKDNVLALCRICHMWIDDNPKQAEEDGFLKPSSS